MKDLLTISDQTKLHDFNEVVALIISNCNESDRFSRRILKMARLSEEKRFDIIDDIILGNINPEDCKYIDLSLCPMDCICNSEQIG